MHTITKNNMNQLIVSIVAVLCLAGLGGCDETERPVENNAQTVQDGGTQIQDAATKKPEAPDAKEEKFPQSPETDPLVSFDVPEGWEYRNEQLQGGPFGAIWETGSSIGEVNKVNLQIHNIFIGGDEEAERFSRESYESAHCVDPYCEPVKGWPSPEFKVIELPGGITLYADIAPTSTEKFWYSRDEQSAYSWGTDFTFSKNGYVFFAYLSDRVDLYTEEMDLITSTLETEDR